MAITKGIGVWEIDGDVKFKLVDAFVGVDTVNVNEDDLRALIEAFGDDPKRADEKKRFLQTLDQKPPL
jgi:Fe-S-cluster formation regulator IscX/YfhJ